jgi:hypothetical protein
MTIMKKQYIKPELEIFCFEAETLMSLSQPSDTKEEFWVEEDGEDAAGTNKFQHGWSSSPWE